MSNPRAIIADVAAKHIGLRETTPNRFAGIDTFWAATNYPDGGKNREPWCSAFASYCVQEADRQSAEIRLRVPPRFAAVRDWLPWARAAGCIIFSNTSATYMPERGDIVIFLPRLSHIGIVAGFAGLNGRSVCTIEGNTNEDGSREGDGCYVKRRSLSFCGSFIRIPTV
jgi:hypothetical protein